MSEPTNSFDKVVRHCLNRGFAYHSSEIYGGLAATYDFGPLGALMLQNIRNIWMRELVQRHRNVVPMEGSIMAHPKVWEASGHVEKFHDPVVHDSVTGARYRADHLLRDALSIDVSHNTPAELQQLIAEHSIKSPQGNALSTVTMASLLVPAQVGGRELYLRGETCQNIFIQYMNLVRTMRLTIPFGVVQIGRVFRNEVTARQFIIRMREFEQMEFEFFVDPDDGKDWYAHWQERFIDLLTNDLGFPRAKLRYRDLPEAERPHYARRAADLEFHLLGDEWLELSPMNHRGDWDLSRHSQFSGKELSFFDSSTRRTFIPHVIETSFGTGRLLYSLLYNGLVEEPMPGTSETRTVLKIPGAIAPYQVAVLPLSKKSALLELSERVLSDLARRWNCDFDASSSIGKRYRRQDEIGTPWCVTIDFDSDATQSVTVRHRDTMRQERVALTALECFLDSALETRS